MQYYQCSTIIAVLWVQCKHYISCHMKQKKNIQIRFIISHSITHSQWNFLAPIFQIQIFRYRFPATDFLTQIVTQTVKKVSSVFYLVTYIRARKLSVKFWWFIHKAKERERETEREREKEKEKGLRKMYMYINVCLIWDEINMYRCEIARIMTLHVLLVW